MPLRNAEPWCRAAQWAAAVAAVVVTVAVADPTGGPFVLQMEGDELRLQASNGVPKRLAALRRAILDATAEEAEEGEEEDDEDDEVRGKHEAVLRYRLCYGLLYRPRYGLRYCWFESTVELLTLA